MNEDFKIIDQSEIEDFRAVVRAHGLNLDDFELIEQTDEPRLTKNGFVFRKGEAVVTKKSTGKARRYRAGDDGTKWVVEFADDIRRGAFD